VDENNNYRNVERVPDLVGRLYEIVSELEALGLTPDSVDTFPSRSILCSQFNLLELGGAYMP
jgi:hypothetical protein